MKRVVFISACIVLIFTGCSRLEKLSTMEKQLEDWDSDWMCIEDYRRIDTIDIVSDDGISDELTYDIRYTLSDSTFTEDQLMFLGEYLRLSYFNRAIEYKARFYSKSKNDLLATYHYKDGKVFYKNNWIGLEDVNVSIWGD